MFKIIYSHKNSTNLTFQAEEFDKLAQAGEIRNFKSWARVLVVFNYFRITLK